MTDDLEIHLIADSTGETAARIARAAVAQAQASADSASLATGDLVLVAPDPRRYGPLETASDGMPSPGGGLFWNLGTAPSGLFFDWGAAGTLGQVTFTNSFFMIWHPFPYLRLACSVCHPSERKALV